MRISTRWSRATAALFILLTSNVLMGQDIHFAHIHASPTILNPAMNGVFRGDIRFIANYRDQWQSITNGYRTFAASVDMPLLSVNRSNAIAGGLVLASDKAGDLDFSTNIVGLSLTGLKSLDRKGNNFISFGMQNAFVNNRVDYTNLHVHDVDPTIGSSESSSISYWDFSAGVGWFYAFSKSNYFYLGSALFHINNPNVSLYEQDQGEGISLFRKVVLHGGGDFRLGHSTSIQPEFVFMDQGPHREINLGGFVRYKRGKNAKRYDYSVYLGGWIRWYAEKDIAGTDAFIAAVKMDFKKTYITFSYDFNLSTLTRASYGRGGPEFSVVKVLEGVRKSPTKVQCPDFYN